MRVGKEFPQGAPGTRAGVGGGGGGGVGGGMGGEGGDTCTHLNHRLGSDLKQTASTMAMHPTKNVACSSMMLRHNRC